jgi:hypothetical protein
MPDDMRAADTFPDAIERFIAVAEFAVTESDQSDISAYGVSQSIAPLFARAFFSMERVRALDPVAMKQPVLPLAYTPPPIEEIPNRAGRTIYHLALNEAREQWGCVPGLFQETEGSTWVGWVIPHPSATSFPPVHFTIRPRELEMLRAAVRKMLS